MVFWTPPQYPNSVGLRWDLKWFLCILKISSHRTGSNSTSSKSPTLTLCYTLTFKWGFSYAHIFFPL